MFESLVEKDEGSGKVKRRAFLVTSVSAIAGLTVRSLRKPRIAQATASKEASQEVTIIVPVLRCGRAIEKQFTCRRSSRAKTSGGSS